MRNIYFDNAASTPPSKAVVERYVSVLQEYYANPSSLSVLGLEAENVIHCARETIAKTLGALPEEIYFTSGGTESNNWAVYGTAYGYHRSGKHIITSATEHPAVTEPFRRLEELGFEVTFLPVDEKGYVTAEALSEALRPDTILVSIIAINNETGTIQDLQTLGKLIKTQNPKTLFHVDAVQAYGKYAVAAHKWNIDLLSASGHKFHAPKGLGFLYMRKGLKVQPLLLGGGQQKGQRSGTENAAGAAALAQAAAEAYGHLEENSRHVLALKRAMLEGGSAIPEVSLNGDCLEKASPYVLNLSFSGVRSEVLLHALEEQHIFVSAGSACDSHKKRHSAVLTAMGMSPAQIEGSLRFSFSKYNTLEEVEACVAVLKQVVPVLRRYQRKG